MYRKIFHVIFNVLFIAHFSFSLELTDELTLLETKEPISFSLNPSNAMAIDSQGDVHIVYFIPDDAGLPPRNRIEYISIHGNTVTSPVRIDRTDIGGGRHPALALDSHDTLHVTWQDYRHTTAAGNYIDNLEIYYNRKPQGEVFLANDIRLSKTHADHIGDNGFVPQIAVGSDDRVHIAWYDFNRNGNNAEIVLLTSSNGEFSPFEGFPADTAEHNFTEYSSFWLPDLAPLSNGMLYMIWGIQEGYSGFFQIEGSFGALWNEPESVDVITDFGGRFLDPSRIASDGDQALGIAYTDFVDNQYEIKFQSRNVQSPWSSALTINDRSLPASQACIALADESTAYTIWQEDLGGIYQVVLAEVDTVQMQVKERWVLSSDDADARTPIIAYDRNTGRLHTAWIERHIDGTRMMKYRSEMQTGIQSWDEYDVLK